VQALCLPASWKDRELSGRIASLPVGLRLSIAPDASCFSADDAALGDSISICGCCLTVVAIHEGMLDFEAGTETLSKTNLGRFVVGSRVNLERSLRADARLGGHIVQGHVDGVATVTDIVRSGDWIDMWFAPGTRAASADGSQGFRRRLMASV
jgi:riboflavin synthase